MTFKVKTKGQIEGEKLLVPKLRFKGFKDEWKKDSLGKIGELKNGISKSKKYFGHGYKFVNLQDIFGKNEIKNGKRDFRF